MPDDSPRAERRQIFAPMPEPTVGGIERDQIDVRDRAYEPTLQRLQPELVPHDLFDVLKDAANPWKLPRYQGAEGTCGGMALAALVDIERARAELEQSRAGLIETTERYPSSPRMIYQLALLKGTAGSEGVSLRDVIKSFYNYGVCRESLWRYFPGDGNPGMLTVERARDARSLSLGAYFRLRPNLNGYHAALHETGSVLVSAELHDGWRHDNVRANGGEIVPPRPGQPRGLLSAEKHAFVIVGYTPQGFLVLNSWGRDWGGWVPPTPRGVPAAEPVPGVALWRYEDWADSIMDGWVLRLGVGAAEAFEYSIGDQGLGFGADAPVRSTPVHAILGNFLHLDDGNFVGSGAYVSTGRTLDETLRLLRDDPAGKAYKGVLLTFAGGLLGLKDATDHVARWKRLVRDEHWYPFTVLWCVDYVEQARGVLDGVFAEAVARAGGPGPRLDRVVEERAHGVGRALWRDIGCAAARAARAGGPLHDLARAGAALAAARPGVGLRIVAESEGAFALSELLRAMQAPAFVAEAAPFFEMLESVDLVAPPLTLSEYSALAYYLNLGWGPGRPERRIRLHLPTARDEKRLAVPPYGLSYFELVRRAFHCRDAVTEEENRLAEIRCPPRRRSGIADKWDGWGAAPRTRLVPIDWPDAAPPPSQGPLNQIQLVYKSDVAGRLRTILRRRRPAEAAT